MSLGILMRHFKIVDCMMKLMKFHHLIMVMVV